jgi:hypothetical protein
LSRCHFAALVGLAAALFMHGARADTPKLVLSPYEQALRLLEQGDCEKGQKLLVPNGQARPGDDIAFTNIGECYLTTKKVADDDEAQRFRETGAGWILLAANRGLRTAQEVAVRLYLDGKVFMIDPYEAGKWYMIWQQNRSQVQYGPVEFDANLLRQMNTTFTPAHWAEAKSRAADWHPTTATSPRPAGVP